MPELSSAFIFVPIRCPICNRESKQRYVKSKLYSPIETDSDQHVVRYKWDSAEFEGIRPNSYHIWHCPHCHFSDEKEVFRGEDTSGGKLELIHEKILIVSKASGSLLTRLGRLINETFEQELLPLDTALAMHLLAIHLQEMLSPNTRQCGKLARFYLRSAWLYREKAAWTLPERGVPVGFSSHAEFLASLRSDWPTLPLTEGEAIDTAIANYQLELSQGKRVEDIRFELNTLFLLSDLHVRRDRLDDALASARNIFQQATRKRQAVRQTLDAAVSKGKGTAQQIESLRALSGWLNNAIDRVTTLSESIQNRVFEKEYPAAREAVLKMGPVTPDAVLARLRELKFREVTCRRIAAMIGKRPLGETPQEPAAPSAAPAPVEEKKGFWESMKSRLGGGS